MKAKISREVLIWVFGVKLKSSKWTKVKMSRGQYDAKYRLNVLISLSHWRKKTFGCMFPSTRQTLDYSCRGGGVTGRGGPTLTVDSRRFRTQTPRAKVSGQNRNSRFISPSQRMTSRCWDEEMSAPCGGQRRKHRLNREVKILSACVILDKPS